MQLQAVPQGLTLVPTKLFIEGLIFLPEESQTDANLCKHFRNESSAFALSAVLSGHWENV